MISSDRVQEKFVTFESGNFFLYTLCIAFWTLEHIIRSEVDTSICLSVSPLLVRKVSSSPFDLLRSAWLDGSCYSYFWRFEHHFYHIDMMTNSVYLVHELPVGLAEHSCIVAQSLHIHMVLSIICVLLSPRAAALGRHCLPVITSGDCTTVLLWAITRREEGVAADCE